MKKRMLTMLLALMLIVSVIPFAASAAAVTAAEDDTCHFNLINGKHWWYNGECINSLLFDSCDAVCEHNEYANGECTRCGMDCAHGSTEVIPGSAATCKAAEVKAGEKCSECGEVLVAPESVGSPLKHKYTVDLGVHKNPTCTEDGLRKVGCSYDNCTEFSYQTIAAAHTPVEIPEVPANCTTAKIKAGSKCSVCQEVLVAPDFEYGTSLGHKFENGVCTECGFVCEHENMTETIPAQAVTCLNAAMSVGKECDDCDYVEEPKAVGVARGHVYSTDEGLESTCIYCLQKCDHEGTLVVTEPAKDATCTAAPFLAGEKCTVCNYEKEGYYHGEGLGHDIVDGKCQRCEIDCPHEHKTWKISASATCVTDGITGGYVCDDCDEILSGREVIDALGHTYYSATPNKCKVCGFECNHENTLEETEEGRPANCYNAEYFPAVKCTVCNYTKDGYHYGVGLGHTWENGVCTVCKAECVHDYEEISKATAATCEVGYTTAAKQCKVCKYVKEAEVITDPLGHDYNMGYVTTDATCLEDGVKTFTCKREGCGHKRTEPVAARGHHVYSTASADLMDTCIYCLHVCDHEDTLVETEKGRPANCYDAEYFPAVKCTECNYTKAGYYYGTGLGHDLKLGDFVSTKPTCLDKGWGRYECQREGCEYTEGGWVPATGHHYEVVQEWNATCTVKGCKKSICKGCNLVRYEDTTPLGHRMQPKDGLEATCSVDGYTAYEQCEHCNLIEGKTAIEAGHEIVDYQCRKCGLYLCDHDGEIEIVESTCSVAGSETFSCETCGYEHTKELPLAAHTVEVETTAATCTEAGVVREICTVCEEELSEIEIPATGHNFVRGVCTNDGCNAKESTRPGNTTPSRPGTSKPDGRPGTSEPDGRPDGTPDDSDTNGSMSGTTNPDHSHDHTHNPGGNGRPSGVVPACGHTHTDTVTQENTCTRNGSVIKYCTDCNTVVETTVKTAPGHNFVMGACAVCGEYDPAVYTNDFNNYYIVGGSTK